jgi:hypothetical protein
VGVFFLLLGERLEVILKTNDRNLVFLVTG